MTENEVPLEGGNMAGEVVRVGDTVRRPASPQSATVHRLLEHVRAAGVTWVPRVHGLDAQGREVLDFIEGDVIHVPPPWLWGDDVLVAAARALRQWHDATATFERRPDDVWWWPGKVPGDVICHNDFVAYNHVYRDGALVGAIDFDLCYPAPRLWDIAWTAYRYVPLTPLPGEDLPDGDSADRSPVPRADQHRRLGAFLDAYGGDDAALRFAEPEALGFVVARLDAVADWCAEQAAEALRANGVMYRAHARWIAGGGLGDAAVVVVADA